MGLTSDPSLSDAQCFDFDRAVLRYWRWYESQANATVWGRVPDPPKGKSRVPKYGNDAEIMRLYLGEAMIDPVIAAIRPEDWEADLNDFSDMLSGMDEAEPEA